MAFDSHSSSRWTGITDGSSIVIVVLIPCALTVLKAGGSYGSYVELWTLPDFPQQRDLPVRLKK